MSKIPLEIAAQEIEKWLDYKKISANKREAREDNIEALKEAIADGYLIVKDDFSFLHTLKFPLENEVVTSTLTYKPRISVSSVNTQMQGVKPADANGMVCAYVSALTGKPKEVVRDLDTEDYSIAQSIAIFFL